MPRVALSDLPLHCLPDDAPFILIFTQQWLRANYMSATGLGDKISQETKKPKTSLPWWSPCQKQKDFSRDRSGIFKQDGRCWAKLESGQRVWRMERNLHPKSSYFKGGISGPTASTGGSTGDSGPCAQCQATLQASQTQAYSRKAKASKLYFCKHSQFLFQKKHWSIMGKIRTLLNYLTLIL